MSAATPIATKLRRGAIRDDVQSGEMDGQQSGSSHVLDDDLKALRAYHAGNRADPRVLAYFERAGLRDHPG